MLHRQRTNFSEFNTCKERTNENYLFIKKANFHLTQFSSIICQIWFIETKHSSTFEESSYKTKLNLAPVIQYIL